MFVVDSADRDRIGTAKDELFEMLAEEELKDSVLLVFAVSCAYLVRARRISPCHHRVAHTSPLTPTPFPTE